MRVVTLMLSLLVAPTAFAGVFLNGVAIDGITNQTFENCTVRIDEKGNVLITAKGYQVQAPQTQTTATATTSAPATPAREPVTKKYFLVSEVSAPALAQYDLDVFINSVWVKRIASTDEQVIIEVSKHLFKGKNVVHVTATKNLKDGRKSVSKDHYIKVHIGEGSVTDSNVVLDNPIIEYTRTAAEDTPFSDDHPLTGR